MNRSKLKSGAFILGIGFLLFIISSLFGSEIAGSITAGITAVMIFEVLDVFNFNK